MGYPQDYNKKEIRKCELCDASPGLMFYIRPRNWHLWSYRCPDCAQMDRETYAMVEIDNLPGSKHRREKTA